MSRELNPAQIWSQVPVANRLIEVNTKTGFSLTAGSYSVRASNTQRGSITMTSVASNTATISSVTVTRATEDYNGNTVNSGGGEQNQAFSTIALTAATTVTCTRGNGTNIAVPFYVVTEYF